MEKIQEVVATLKNKGYKVRLKDETPQIGQNQTTLQVNQGIFPLFELIISKNPLDVKGGIPRAPEQSMQGLLQDLPSATDFSVMSFARIACTHKIPIAAVSQLKAQDGYFLKVSF